jgi:hypothetical protein
MNNPHDDLLADLLAEGGAGSPRDALLGETLRHVRRRRRARQAVRGAGLLLIAGALGMLVLRHFSVAPIAARVAKIPAQVRLYQLVTTQPLSQEMIVSTQPYSGGPARGLAGSFVEVSTTHDGLRLINDDELLALVADKGGALVRTGPHSERLILPGAGD